MGFRPQRDHCLFSHQPVVTPKLSGVSGCALSPIARQSEDAGGIVGMLGLCSRYSSSQVVFSPVDESCPVATISILDL